MSYLLLCLFSYFLISNIVFFMWISATFVSLPRSLIPCYLALLQIMLETQCLRKQIQLKLLLKEGNFRRGWQSQKDLFTCSTERFGALVVSQNWGFPRIGVVPRSTVVPLSVWDI